jgi:hypothetical protein
LSESAEENLPAAEDRPRVNQKYMPQKLENVTL